MIMPGPRQDGRPLAAGGLGNRLMQVQLTFVIVQLFDILTTMVALRLGGAERNPLVVQLMHIGVLPGLLVSKSLIVAIALVATLSRKPKVLLWSNVLFGGVVTWNLVVIGRLILR